jgi:hypothetical protein
LLKHNQLLQQLNHIDELYDLLDDWDDAYDYLWEDLSFVKLYELVESHLLTNQFHFFKNNLFEKNNITSSLMLFEKMNLIKSPQLKSMPLEYNLMLPLQLLTYQYKLNIIN